MTITRTEVDGKEYLVIHYKFAIHQPNAEIYIGNNGLYYAKINNIVYVLGYGNENPTNVSNEINRKVTQSKGAEP
jgi:hypothetical protein